MPHSESLALPNHDGDRGSRATPSAAAASGGVGPVVAQDKHAAAPSSTAADRSQHLWCAAGPSSDPQGTRPVAGAAAAAAAAAAPEAGGRPARVPAQSPLLPVDWWRRPPSPLVSHARPLWRSSSGSFASTPTFAAAAAAEAAAATTGLRKRARSSPAGATASLPSEGEAAGGGSSLFRLDSTQSARSMMTPGSSVISQDSTFFTRKPAARPKSGGWSSSAIDAAPPPPMMSAPTPSSSGAVAAAAAAAAAAAEAASGGVSTAGSGSSSVNEESSSSTGRSPTAEAAAKYASYVSFSFSSSSSSGEEDLNRARNRGGPQQQQQQQRPQAQQQKQRPERQRMPTQPKATLSKDSLEDGVAGGETRDNSAAAGWGSRRGEERRSRVPRNGAGVVPPRKEIDEGSPPQTLSALRREALDPNQDEDQDESEQWEGGGGGGGRAGAAAGGSGGGNPARGLPNKLYVRRRSESFKESVSTGLANAIAEMQAGLPSDDDSLMASKEKRHGGGGGGNNQHVTLKEGSWSAGADSGGGLLKRDGDGGNLKAGTAGRPWPKTNPKQLPVGMLSEGSSVASSGEGFELPESFCMGVRAKEGSGGRGERRGPAGEGGGASPIGSQASRTSSKKKRSSSSGRSSRTKSISSRGWDNQPPPETASRRGRRSESRVTRGTRPEREAGGSGRLWQQGAGAGGASDGQRSQQRKSAAAAAAAAAADGRGGRQTGQPSPRAPLRVGGRELRRGGSSGSSRRGRKKKTGNDDGDGPGKGDGGGAAAAAARGPGGGGELGGRAGVVGSGRFLLGRVGRGSGKAGDRASGRDWSGKELRRTDSTVSSEGDEMHYVNPMNLHRRSAPHINSYPKGGGSAGSEHRGSGLPNLLRRFSFLRRSWRGGKQQGQGTAEGGKGGLNNGAMNDNQRMEFLADKALKNGGKGGGDGGPSGLEELGLGAAVDFDGDELDMACR
ncbi:unnamed protein product [Ectocarpus fasciculatus]